MVLGCIDIGSNTTRLLVAEASGGSLRPLLSRRAFTRIGKSLLEGGAIPAGKIEETAEVVGAQAREAREAGARELVAVATAAIRDAPNRHELCSAVEEAGGMRLEVLSGEEEARLAFVGAARTLAGPATGTMAVIDVGGGSSEIAVGEPDGSVAWSRSFPIGSGVLTDAHLRSDPPAEEELAAARAQVERTLAGLHPPSAGRAAAVGGTATSLRRLLGGQLSSETLQQGLSVLSSTPIAEVASRFELEPERVRLLPGGILVLVALSAALGLPLEIARGGLREGVLLELAERRRG